MSRPKRRSPRVTAASAAAQEIKTQPFRPVTAYTRVSSRSQDLATQRSAILRAAAARGDTIALWFEEKASARTIERAELRRLREAARRGDLPSLAGSPPRVYTFRIDRLARSGIRDTFEVIEELRSAGVELVSVADGFDLNGPAAEVVLAVMAWAAQMERLATNERISATRERFEVEGRSWGRPPRMTAAQVKRARALKAAGYTIRDISQRVCIPRATLHRALSRKGGLEKAASSG